MGEGRKGPPEVSREGGLAPLPRPVPAAAEHPWATVHSSRAEMCPCRLPLTGPPTVRHSLCLCVLSETWRWGTQLCSSWYGADLATTSHRTQAKK